VRGRPGPRSAGSASQCLQQAPQLALVEARWDAQHDVAKLQLEARVWRVVGRSWVDCALVPPPRKHLVTYHGALAPAAGLRPKVVPRQTAAGAAAGCRHGASDGGVSEAAGAENAATPAKSAIAAVCRQQAERGARARLRAPHRGGQSRSRRQRLPWADLLRRTFGIDVLVCPQCAGPRRVLAAIHDPAAIARVLGALGLTAAGADPAGCRAPPAAAGFDAADEGNAAE
jgi:hypothetical protein